MRRLFPRLLALGIATVLIIIGAGAVMFLSATSALPEIFKVDDYKPLLVTEVYAKGGERMGEFMRENRTLVPIDKIPEKLIEAFLATEDRKFYEHKGINYLAIARALLEGFRGERIRGASTITQQLAKQLFLTPERTLTRKLREAVLAKQLEEHLSKKEILYLYLNQIYFGSGAHGVAAAAETYFRKELKDLTLAEIAMIAGLPQRPTDWSPIANPKNAKRRQREVLNNMAEVGYITAAEAEAAANEVVKVYIDRSYRDVAPFVMETIRQMLVAKIGEAKVLDEGLKVYTSIDFQAQQAAQEQVREGLRAVDKRQGYRGPLRRLEKPEELENFFVRGKKALEDKIAPVRFIEPEKPADTEAKAEKPAALPIFQKLDAQKRVVSNLPPYATKGQIVEAVITRIEDGLGLVEVRFADVQALMDLKDFEWARKPDPNSNPDYAPKLAKPSLAFKVGDVVLVKITGDKFVSPRSKDLLGKIAAARKAGGKLDHLNFDNYAQVALDQEPAVEGSLISFDLKTGQVAAMVGGYDFARNQFNRALQAKRQTGSSFKSIVYAAALDKGYTPATLVQDTPLVFEGRDASNVEGQDSDMQKWKPSNHGEKFSGDILFRTALSKSLNIPTVKILENIGVSWALEYARRLGIFSPLNPDLSLGLGSSSVTLYEMTKAFSHFARLGKRIRPKIVEKVIDRQGNVILDGLSLDEYFAKDLGPMEEEFEQKRQAALAKRMGEAAPEPTAAPTAAPEDPEIADPSATPGQDKTLPIATSPRLFFDDPDQLISPQTAYVATTLLQSTVNDEGGTAARARALGRPVAGKTGSTNGYFDGWFVGYTTQYATGVWVGFDEERSLGLGEVGGRTALPIWLEFMKATHGDEPGQNFSQPPGIVIANIDAETGKLASVSSRKVLTQAFIRGTEPRELSGVSSGGSKDDSDFLKEDLAN
ncbi:MAG TPA: PBP1A family penicillin-binding protein [Pseudobdellovibrionaceae bacterium]|nr:PBP1A family penicillin-binding protein [Pseudobdellovibrionaceae bacterium]